MRLRARRLLCALLMGAGACATLGPTGKSAAEPKKRPVPDYDGRGERPTTPGRALLWVPRVLLFPAYFVSEYLIRRPLGFVITAAEKAELPATLYDFFAFGPDHKSGVVPIGFIDFGFQPSVGLYGFWDDAGFDGHDLRIRGSTGGSDWLSGTLTERFRFTPKLDLTLTATALRRPDFAFYGVGPNTRESSLSRYSADSVDAHLQTRIGFAGSSWLETASGYRGVSFGQGDYAGERSLTEAVRSGHFDEPPGYRDGYRAGLSRAKLVLDTRQSESASATGARLELEALHGADLGRRPASGWLRYGGTLGGFLDLSDSGRVLGLSVTTLFADPLGSRPVPFTELATLGGAGLMPGFRDGRLYDRSALVATLRYSWPIWIWLNGSLQAATGNVFGERLSALAPERARLSAAIGVESSGSRDSIFLALIGFGSETFESGAELDSLRIVIGARNGF